MRMRNAEILAARIPNARLEILKGVAHGIPMTDDRAIARAVTSIAELNTSRRDPRNGTAERHA